MRALDAAHLASEKVQSTIASLQHLQVGSTGTS